MWNDGYTAEINYTSGYYPELSPTRIKMILLAAGVDHAVPDDATYLELGFGQGLSLLINAATNSGRYYGNDFNPGQVANARELAEAMGKPLTLLEDSFEQLAARTDLPEFDYVCLHGIWSWVSDGSRKAILDMLASRLRPGGAVLISYNATPGWSPEAPLRNLLAEYAGREASGTLPDRVEQSIGFVDRVFTANAAYFVANPALKGRFDKIKQQDRTYVTHEYFNHHWEPMSFSRVADTLAQAKLTYAASAKIYDNLPGISIPPAARQVLAEIRDPVLRETTRDYFINQRFRRDVFVKGPRPITPPDYRKRVEGMRFILLGNPASRPTKIVTAVGEVNLREAIYKPVVEALAKAPDCSATVGELMAATQAGSLTLENVWEALLVLSGTGFVSPASPSATPDADAAAAAALNAVLLERAQVSAGVGFLAAPKLGGGIAVSRIEQLFVRALQLGEKDPVAYVWGILSSQRQRVVAKGQAIESEKDNRAELKRIFAKFEKDRADVLRRVGVLANDG